MLTVDTMGTALVGVMSATQSLVTNHTLTHGLVIVVTHRLANQLSVVQLVKITLI
jgi:hypothetical protein